MSRIRTNLITNRMANGAPTVSNGLVISGVTTSTTFSGSGALLTNLPAQATISNNSDNRVITGGSGVNLNGEVDLVWDGSRMGVLNQAPQNQYFNTLVVGNNSAGDKGITIRTNNTSKGVLAFSDTDSADANRYDGYIAYQHSDQSMRFNTGGANERLRITSSGAVGIGTDTPAGGSYLHVHGSGASDKNHIRLTADRGLIARLGDTSGSAQSMFDLYGTDGSTQIVRFISGGGDNFINTGGRVIIGDDDADKANGNFDDLVIGSNASTTETHGITIVCGNAATNGGIAFSDGSAGGADAYRGMISYQHNDNHMQFRTNAVEKLRVESGGDIKVATGDLYFGTAGKGIVLGNTSNVDANTLDDYEEGSWTPTVNGWDTYSPYSGASYNYAWYVKVGGMVHVGWKIYIQNLTTVSSSPHISISGLPFAHQTYAAGPVGHTRFDIPEFGNTGYPITYMGGGGTVLYMYKHTSSASNLVAINATSNRSNVWTMGTATYATNA